MTYLLSHQGEGAGLTCMLTRLPAKTLVESHSHCCEEIIYVIRGKATMEVDGAGAGFHGHGVISANSQRRGAPAIRH